MARGKAVVGGVIAVVAIVVVVVLILAGGGSDDEPATSSSTSSTTEAYRPATVEEAPGSLPAGTASTSSVPEDGVAAADEILAAAGPNLALTPEQEVCLANRLAGDEDLRTEVGETPEPGSDGYGALVEAGERCVLEVDAAPAFVATIEPSLEGELTDEDRSCLADAFATSSDEDRQSILQAGLEPESDAADAGRAVLDAMLASCDLARPTG